MQALLYNSITMFITLCILFCVQATLMMLSKVIILRDLFNCGEKGKALAVATFKEHRDFYHSVAATLLAKDLELQPLVSCAGI